MSKWGILCALLLILANADGKSGTPISSYDGIFTLFGLNIGEHVENRIIGHLESVSGLIVESLEHADEVEEITRRSKGNYLIFSAGNTTLAESYTPLKGTSFHLDGDKKDYLEPDSFRLRYQSSVQGYKWPALISNGLPLSSETHKNTSLNKDLVHYGAVVGAYAGLEALGFGFLHPLEPFIPSSVSLATACEEGSVAKQSKGEKCEDRHNCCIDVIEEPHWTERSFHLHTQHPIELTEVLQGHDIPQFGPHGPRCRLFSEKRDRMKRRRKEDAQLLSVEERRALVAARQAEEQEESSTPYCERWEDMVRDVDLMFEWAVANRQNKIEWLLLGNYKWGDEFHTRNKRLKLLTGLGHRYSLLVGADVPLGNIQQHGWNIVNIRSPLKAQTAQIQTRVDWVFSAGFDFMTTESGLSEFHAPECGLMLKLLNEFASYVNVTWGREAGVKVHCSTGQVCMDYEDPVTGDPLNFNFLPYYAHKGLGVFPHTIQIYSLDDPTAGAYGNKDFGYMEEYMVHEAKAGNRSVMFYPETAYWVNVDVDVPLFLPVYGQRRQHDLRRLARREHLEHFKIDGQMNFDSGWEWGYWLSDVVTARQAWQPTISPAGTGTGTGTGAPECVRRQRVGGAACTEQEYPEATTDQWDAFPHALRPLTRLFSPEIGGRLERLLVSLTKAQYRLLVRGEVVEGVPSPNLKKLQGIAYISGGDTWIDLPHMLGQHTLQPTKIHLRETADPDWRHVHPLLRAMETDFGSARDTMDGILADATAAVWAKLAEESAAQASPFRRAGQLFAPEGGTGSAGEDASSSDPSADDTTDDPSSVAASQEAQSRQQARLFERQPQVAILQELADCVAMLALRARQVRLLYMSKHLQTFGSAPDYRPFPPSAEHNDTASAEGCDVDAATGLSMCPAGSQSQSQSPEGPGGDTHTAPDTFSDNEGEGAGHVHMNIHKTATEIQGQARAAIGEATALVARMESNYRVPWQRVAEWRENPTVYRYGYLWSVHSLYYWWRDQGLTEGGSVQSKYSPCYLNRMDLVEIGLGWGQKTLENLRYFVNTWSPFRSGYPLELVNCLSAPKAAYQFPRDLFK